MFGIDFYIGFNIEGDFDDVFWHFSRLWGWCRERSVNLLIKANILMNVYNLLKNKIICILNI